MPKTSRFQSLANVDPYIKDIHAISLLSADEERELASRIAAGDVEARDKLVQANLRLVVNIAKDFRNRGVSYEDLIAEGNLGLIRASEGYDGRNGVRFATYAAFWIRQSIRNATIKHGKFIRLPSYAVTLITKWRRATALLATRLEREPSEAEVMAELRLSARKLGVLRQALQTADLAVHGNSVNSDDGNESDATSFEQLIDGHEQAPVDRLAEEELTRRVLDRLALMEPREEGVVRLRYGLDGDKPRTLQEIGDHLGLTRERIRQLERKALAALAE